VQEAQTAIERYEAAARSVSLASTLDAIEGRFAAAEANGSLANKVREVVLANRAQAAANGKAA
jgi:hypothetical protein